ncbi:hypothetical protein IAT38_002437 [Cryptococcus sp. DSM 104549]
MPQLLEVKDLSIHRDSGSAILSHLNLTVSPGEVLVVRGPSGSGKSTLLKCIAELNLYQTGEISFNGTPSGKFSPPEWRVKVAYVPQRPSILPGTPMDLLQTVRKFGVRKQVDKELGHGGDKPVDPLDLAQKWGIDKVLWTRSWETLSGGEAQRVALAVAVGIGGAEILLLDEPTSALDEVSSKKVEESLISMLPPLQGRPSSENGVKRTGTGPKALIWITHSAEQAERVGTRTLDLGHQHS